MRGEGAQRRFLGALGVTTLVTALLTSWIGLSIGGARTTLYVDDLATVLAALTATALCARAAAHQQGRMRRFWALLAGACGAWTLGETTWAFYDLVLVEEVPVPSWADIGYLGAIPLAIAALLSHPAMHRPGLRLVRSLFDGLVIATALLFVSWTVVLGALWESTDLATAGGIVAFAYPFGDAVIIFFIVLTVRALPRGDNLEIWCLLAGLLALGLADGTYTYLSGVKGYETGQLLDVGWILGYLAIALGAFCADVRPSALANPDSSQPSLVSLVVPFAALLGAVTLLAIQIGLGNRPDQVATIIAFCLIGLVLARQALIFWDLLGLKADPQSTLSERLNSALMTGGSR